MCYCGVYVVFFVKQMTAYEMGISDGSSDVCSSDLLVGAKTSRMCRAANSAMSSWCLLTPPIPVVAACHHCWFSKNAWTIRLKGGSFHAGSVNRRSWGRSEGRSVGKEFVRECRSRWSPDH